MALDQNGSLPLHHACYCEKPNAQVVELLVAAGSDVNAVDDQGYTALIVAAKKNQTEIVSSLLAHGADRSIRNMVRLPKNGLCHVLTEMCALSVWGRCAALRHCEGERASH